MKKTVIDLGFGDSGKGMFTAYLCSISNNPIVVRFSGGHQAGHTVVHNGIRHVFSSFGSGTLQNVPTYWSENCTFYPVAFLNELNVLEQKGIEPKIFVNGKCPVTTFFDVLYNKKIEGKNQHGSCGVGFGATLEREEKHYSLLVEDLLFPSITEIKLKMIMDYYNQDEDIDCLAEYEFFLKDCKEVIDKIFIVNSIEEVKLHDCGQYNDIIYEGSQGLLLDKNIGFFPHVTRANLGANIINDDLDEIFYITRAYQTRHGNGPMLNEDIRHNIIKNPNETNKKNYQGKFRRTLLDADLLTYAIWKDMGLCFKKNKYSSIRLVITCLDHIENEYRFTYKGEIVHCLDENEFINKISNILCIPKEYVYISKSDEYKDIIAP